MVPTLFGGKYLLFPFALFLLAPTYFGKISAWWISLY